MSRNQQAADDIIFEDLHGVADDEGTVVEVDLDASDEKAVTRKTRVSEDDGTPTGDDHDDIDYGTSDKDGGSDDDESDDGDRDSRDDRFSKKFQARLKREQRAKRRERDRAEKAERDNDRLRKQLKRASRSDSEDKDKDLERQIETVESELEQAIEDGKSKEQVRLSSRLTDLKAERIAAKYTSDDDDDDDPDDDASSTTPRKNELADDWVDRHSGWYGQRGFGRFTTLARRIDKEVSEDGFDPFDEDYFEEMDRRLMEEAPELFDEDGEPVDEPPPRSSRKQTRQAGRKQDKRSPVASADDASRDKNPKPSSSKVELGPTEFANMRRFGLDPRNPDHVKEYAMNKRQADLEEAQQ